MTMRNITVILLLSFCCAGAFAQEETPTPSPDKQQRVARLLDNVEELEDLIPLEYAQKKKQELLKKYPDLEKDYIAFLKEKYPDLKSEIISIFKKYSEDLRVYGQLDASGEPVVSFQTMEQMCLNSKECADDIRDLFKEKHPDFAQVTARYILDKKPELLVELAIVTLEVLTGQQQIGSATTEHQ